MRIAYLIDSLGSGGAQRQVVELAAMLVQRGDIHARFAVYQDQNFFADRLREASVPVDRIPKRAKLDPFFPLRLRAWFREHPVDLVHAFLLPPSLWSLIALRSLGAKDRPKLIASERNSVIASSLQERWLQSIAYRGADAVTVNAETVAPEIAQKLSVPEDRISYIPNGIDLSRWDQQMAQPARIEFSPEFFHIALVGRLTPQKNAPLLIRALARLPREKLGRLRVWLIGRNDGQTAAEIDQQIKASGLSEIVGTCPPEREIAPIMAALGAVVLPARYEGFPNVVLEAMAAGTPVVATPVGDVPNLVEHGDTGLLVPTNDDRALADAILWLLGASPDELRRMGEAARRVVEAKFRLSEIADRYLHLYRKLIG